MKKFLLSGIIVLITISLYANPIPPPYFFISDFMFTGSNNWEMELNFFETFDYNYGVDSIFVQSGSGSAKVIAGYWEGWLPVQFYCFTSQDLNRPLTINPNGDTISATGYFHDGNNNHYIATNGLSFGNYPNAVVLAPTTSQQIVLYLAYYCPDAVIYSLDNLTGWSCFENDTTGAMSAMTGIVYGMNGTPVPNETFNIDFKFTTDANGHYSTRIFSRIKTLNIICYQQYPGNFEVVTITPISYSLEPDSVITRNINLTEKIITGIPSQSKNTNQNFNIFPNPVKDVIIVSYSANLDNDSGDLSINIYDINGKKVLEKRLENRIGIVNIPVELVNGAYFATLRDKGTTLGTVHFIVDRSE